MGVGLVTNMGDGDVVVVCRPVSLVCFVFCNGVLSVGNRGHVISLSLSLFVVC